MLGTLALQQTLSDMMMCRPDSPAASVLSQGLMCDSFNCRGSRKFISLQQGNVLRMTALLWLARPDGVQHGDPPCSTQHQPQQ